MRKILKVIGWIIGGILLLVIAAILVLQMPFGKKFVKDKILSILRSKLKTEVYIGSIDYALPKMLELNDVLLRDEAKDTLLSAHKLRVDMNMLKLISGKVVIQQVELDGITSHIYRNLPDTSFNYAFIMRAFAGDPNTKKDPTADEVKNANDTSSSMSFDVDRVLLSNIHIRFDDYTGGSRLGLDLNSLLLQLDKLDPTNMDFGIKKLAVHGLATTYIQDTSYLPPIPKDTTAGKPVHLSVGEVTLDDIAVNYNDKLGKLLFDLNLQHLLATPKEIDLTGERINIDRLVLDSTKVRLAMGKTSVEPVKADSVADTAVNQMNWRVNVADIKFHGVDFKMDNDNMPIVKQGMDYGHLDVKNLAVDLQSLLYSSDTISGDLQHLAVQEQSGLDLQELKTNFNYNSHGAVLNDLYVKTDKTLIQNHIEATYPSLEALQKDMQTLKLDIDVQNSQIGMKDVLIFAPQLTAQLGQFRNATLKADAVLKGYLNNLDITKFYVAGLSNTEISLSGKVSGLPDANRVRYNLDIAKIKSSSRDVNPFLPPAMAAQYRLPDVFALTGKVNGTAKDYNTQLVLMTTDGDAYLKGYVYMSPGKNRERYDLYLKTRRLNVGRILKMDTLLGQLTMDWAVKGVSFDPKYMTASLKGRVDNAYVKGYNYGEITLKGTIARQKGNIALVSADKNLTMNLVANADMSPKYPAISATLNLDSANLQALKLSASPLKMSTIIVADVPVMNVDYPQATVTLTTIKVLSDNKQYILDSLYVSSKPGVDSSQNIKVDLGVLNAMITGHIPLSRMGEVIQEHISRHYVLADSITANNSATKTSIAGKQNRKPDPEQVSKPLLQTYDLHIAASVKKTPFLTSIVPDITRLDSVRFTADLDPRNLKVNLTAPTIVYGTNTIKGTRAVISGVDSGLAYNIGIEEFSQPSFNVINTTLHGNINAHDITANLTIQDTGKKDRFALAATIQQIDGDNIISLGNGLILDYKRYEVAQPNKIVVGGKGFYADNFKITNGAEVISINSTPAAYNAPLNAQVSNFVLGNITKMFSKGDTLIANGVLNLNATVTQFSPNLLFTADLKVDDLSVRNDTLGVITANAATQDGNDVTAKLAFDGNGNDIKLTGDYYMQPVDGNNFNFDLNLNTINLKSFEGLAMNQIRNSSGNLKGKFNIQGTADKPKVNGELITDQLKTTIAMINSAFYMPSEKISIDENNITFHNFTIQDSASHKFSIDGEIATTDFKKMELDLKLKANNFRAVHSTQKDNKEYYGDVYLSTNLSISGEPESPSIDGNFNINKGTKFTLVLPEKEVGLEDYAGIVKFVDKSDPHPEALQPVADSTPKMAFQPGGGINVNIGIDQLAEFSVVIDQATGDFLRVRGEASLNASVSPGGDLSLTGIYELKEGGYQLNYNFLKRKFNIKDGSTITFAGDPLDAVADITAIYVANIPPYDLIAKQVDDPAQLVYFKQRLPFDVLLKMKGKLMSPVISFDIDLPEDKTYRITSDNIDLVQAKLTQLRTDTSELNKQVFAVLILSRFVGEDPFNSGVEGGGVSFAAKQSAGRFLSEQLNKYAGSLIKGVDLSFDLASTEDYTSGDRRERTDLNIAASKRLLNDRLTVTVGNNFELDNGGGSNANQNTSVIPGNLSADYKLTEDGRYSARVYRQTQDQGVLEGFVTETGVKFIMTFDYNRFKNLLNRKKRMQAHEEQRKKEQREEDEKSGKTGFIIDRREDDYHYTTPPTNE